MKETPASPGAYQQSQTQLQARLTLLAALAWSARSWCRRARRWERPEEVHAAESAYRTARERLDRHLSECRRPINAKRLRHAAEAMAQRFAEADARDDQEKGVAA